MRFNVIVRRIYTMYRDSQEHWKAHHYPLEGPSFAPNINGSVPEALLLKA